ncbi:hypothetical protein JMG10_07180 [Nostoc ellipsosporum NOK]|nr:hypothetical protein [Nostoc ellipsosporum NOK]
MNREKFNGTWVGEYIYGDGYPDDVQGRREEFSLHLQFDGHRFKGTCEDCFTRELFNEPATVEGEVTTGQISFIKRYPALLLTDEHGHCSVDRDQPPYEIVHHGLYTKGFFSRIHSFRGHWEIVHSFVDEEGPYQSICSGEWWFEKVK